MTIYAEKEAVERGFEEVGERFEGFEDQFKAVEKMLKEVDQQFRRTLKSWYSGGGWQGARERGQTVFATEDHAKAFGELVLVAGKRMELDQAKHLKDMSTGVSTEGGFLVPEELMSGLIDLLGTFGKFRANCTVVPIGSAVTSVPRLDTDVTVFCPGEGNAITPSDVKVGQVKLLAKTLAALTAVSNELVEDSMGAVGEIVARSIARALAKKEDQIGFVGDGTAAYFGMRGIVGALRAVDATISNIKGLKVASGNAYSEITLGDFRATVALLPEDFEAGARWYMSKTFYYTVVWPLAETAGVANIFEILSDKKSYNLLGYPVEFVSAMPSTEANSQICAVLGDLKAGAYIGERKVLTIDQSRDVYFASYQTGILGAERIDINSFGVGDTTNPGPIVGLITAAG